MEAQNFFLILFLILIVARIFGELFARLNIPSVLGELFAGIFLGSSMLGIVQPNEILKILAEIRVILLLFEVGIETDFTRLKNSGFNSFIGAAVIDDIIGIILLVFIYDFSISHEANFRHTLSVSGMILLFLILAPILAKTLSFLIHKFHGRELVPGYIPTIIISLILLLSYLSHLVGAPAILGSFAAGIALSRRFFLPFGSFLGTNELLLEDVKKNMTPIIQIFTPIFFVMVGLSMNLRVIDFSSSSFWIMGLSFISIAFITKFLGAFLIMQKCAKNNALIGISMIPRGEVGLIFAEMGRVSGILPNEIYAMLIFVIIITTIIPPFLLKKYFKGECV